MNVLKMKGHDILIVSNGLKWNGFVDLGRLDTHYWVVPQWVIVNMSNEILLSLSLKNINFCKVTFKRLFFTLSKWKWCTLINSLLKLSFYKIIMLRCQMMINNILSFTTWKVSSSNDVILKKLKRIHNKINAKLLGAEGSLWETETVPAKITYNHYRVNNSSIRFNQTWP